MPKLVLKVFLQSAHFQESCVRLRQKFDEKIKVTVVPCLTGGTRSEQLHARHGMTLAHRTDRRSEARQIERFWWRRNHGGKVAAGLALCNPTG